MRGKIEAKILDVYKSELDFRNINVLKRWGVRIAINMLFMAISIAIGLTIRRFLM